MGKVDPFIELLEQIDAQLSSKLTTENEKHSKSLLDNLKEVSSIVSKCSGEEIAKNSTSPNSIFLRYFSLLIRLVDHSNASIRLHAEQEYDFNIKKLVIHGATELSLRIIVTHLQGLSSGRAIVILLSRVDYMFSIVSRPSRIHSPKFALLSDTIAGCILNIMSRPEAIVHKSLEQYFPTIINYIQPDRTILLKIHETALNLIIEMKGTVTRTLAVVLYHSTIMLKNKTNETLCFLIENMCTAYLNSEKPSTGVLIAMKSLVEKREIGSEEEMKKAVAVLLCLIASKNNEIIFLAFSVLESILKNYTMDLDSFDPSSFVLSNKEENIVNNGDISPPVKEIIDPLMNPSKYEEIQQASELSSKTAEIKLPQVESIMKCPFTNLRQYIAAFLSKAYLLTGVHRSLKNDLESKDSMKILAMQCLIPIADELDLSQILVNFEGRYQSVSDCIHFSLHSDEALAAKALALLSCSLKFFYTEDMEGIIVDIIKKPRANLIKKRALLENLAENNIKFISSKKVFASLLKMSQEMCYSNNLADIVSATQFISSISFLEEGESRSILETNPFLEEAIFDVLKSGLISNKPIIYNHIIRFLRIESFQPFHWPSLRLDLVLNTQFDPMTITKNSSDRIHDDVALCMKKFVTNATLNSDVFMQNFINVCARLFREIPLDVNMHLAESQFIEYLNTFNVKQQVILAALECVSKLSFGKWLQFLNCNRAIQCREKAYELFIHALRGLNLIHSLTMDRKPEKKVLENVDSRVVKIHHIFLPARSAEEGPSFPRQANISFDQCEAFSSIFNDLKGALNNFRLSLTESGDAKFQDFCTSIADTMCTALEFIDLDDFNFFDETVEYLNRLIEFSPLNALKIMHQIIKIIFSRNLLSIDFAKWNKIKENYDLLFKNYHDVSTIFENDPKMFKVFLKRSLGWLGLEVSRPETNEKILQSLEKLENLITIMIRLFRCRGTVVKQKVILLMIELIRAGIMHDMADPNYVIYNEVMKCLLIPRECTYPEIFEDMTAFLVVYSRVQSYKTEQLVDVCFIFIQSIAELELKNAKYAIRSATIILIEMIHQRLDLKRITSALSSSVSVLLRNCPNDALNIFYVLFCGAEPTEIGSTSIAFMTNYIDVLLETSFVPPSFQNVLHTLSKLPESVFNPFDIVYDGLCKATPENVWKFAPLIVTVAGRVTLPALDLRLNDIEKVPQEWFERVCELSLTCGKNNELEIYKEYLRTYLEKNHPTIFVNLTAKGLLSTDNSKKRLSSEHAVAKVDCIWKARNCKNKKSISNICSTNAVNETILLLSKDRSHLLYVCRYLYEMEFDEMLELCIKIDSLYMDDKFWLELINEFKFRSQDNGETKTDLSKLQNVVDYMISNLSYCDILFKIMANLKGIKVDISDIDVDSLNHLLKWVANNWKPLISKEYIIKGLIFLLHDSNVIEIVNANSFKTISTYLQILKSIVYHDELKSSYYNSLSETFICDVNFEIDDEFVQKYLNGYTCEQIIKKAFCMSQVEVKRHKFRKVEQMLKSLRLILLRHPILHVLFTMPISAIEMGWRPQINIKQDSSVFVPITKVHFLCYHNVLSDFQARISLVGWLNRAQFEDICVSLLGVLSTTPTGNELTSNGGDVLFERIKCSSLAVDIFTSILLNSLKFPFNGDPFSDFILKTRERTDPFYSSEEMNVLSILKSYFGFSFKHAYCQNVERYCGEKFSGTTQKYGIGQISVMSLWSICGVLSTESGRPKNFNTGPVMKIRPSLSQYLLETTSDLDTVSNVRSLLGIISHWFSHGIDQLPSALLAAVIDSLQYLSDFFDDLTTYDFMYKQMKIIFYGGFAKGLHREGTVIGLLLKSLAVLGFENVDNAMGVNDKLKMIQSWIETGLTSEFQSYHLNTLAGVLYLLQSFSLDMLKPTIEYVSGYISLNVKSVVGGDNQEMVGYFLAVMFRLLEEPLDLKQKNTFIDSVVEILYHTENNETMMSITECLEQFLLHSASFYQECSQYVNLYAKKLQLIGKSDVRDIANFRLAMACIMRYSTTSFTTTASRLEALANDLLTLYLHTKSHQIRRNGLRALPILLVTAIDVKNSVLAIMKLLDNSEKLPVLRLLCEFFDQCRLTKSWSRKLAPLRDDLLKEMEDKRQTDPLLYSILKCALSSEPEKYLKVSYLIDLYGSGEDISNDQLEQLI